MRQRRVAGLPALPLAVDKAAIAAEVAARFAQFGSSDGIRIPARVNVFTALAP